ncbi:MAG: uracil phosphoribosyltransferase [Lewinellaceae bacterium]|nr:uracil phosphoribosyltransferase [Lewinellaceae bacterium]
MTTILSHTNSIASRYIAQMRNIHQQHDRLRFRHNMERLGMMLAFEISKTIPYEPVEIETPLGIATCQLPQTPIVLGTILRAGLPLHQGMLQVFDDAENAFISAYRKHHKDGTFEINLEYVSCPDLTDKILILADPMLASGASMVIAAQELQRYGKPRKLIFVTAIAAVPGLEYLERNFPQADYWIGALDEELTAKSYIVPGLGDAGDLSFGEKLQD